MEQQEKLDVPDVMVKRAVPVAQVQLAQPDLPETQGDLDPSETLAPQEHAGLLDPQAETERQAERDLLAAPGDKDHREPRVCEATPAVRDPLVLLVAPDSRVAPDQLVTREDEASQERADRLAPPGDSAPVVLLAHEDVRAPPEGQD